MGRVIPNICIQLEACACFLFPEIKKRRRKRRKKKKKEEKKKKKEDEEETSMVNHHRADTDSCFS